MDFCVVTLVLKIRITDEGENHENKVYKNNGKPHRKDYDDLKCNNFYSSIKAT